MNTLSFALAYLVGGILADRLFEPLIVEDGLLANVFGQFIGAGHGVDVCNNGDHIHCFRYGCISISPHQASGD